MGLQIQITNQTELTFNRTDWEPNLAEEVDFDETPPQKIPPFDTVNADTEDTSIISFAGSGAASLKCIYEVDGVQIGFNVNYPGSAVGIKFGDLTWSYLATPNKDGKTENWTDGSSQMVSVKLAKKIAVEFEPTIDNEPDTLGLSIAISTY